MSMLDVQDGNGARSLSPRQARIVAQLSRLVGSGPADFFRDACEMLVESPSHRSATHLISHALREADSALRYILEPRTFPNTPSPDKRGKKRKQQEEKRGHLQSITAVCAALDLPTDHPVAVFWLEQAERDSPTNLAGRAHRHALERARPLDREFRNYFARFEDLFELVLGRFEEQYVRVFDRLDALLGSEPTIELAKELRQRLPSNPVTRQRFFSRAAAAWIGPLTEEGFFKFPPEPRLDPTDGSVEVPAWPESDYLARVAADVPGDVVRAVLEMAPTENSRVVWDLTRLALAIPPDEAATLAPKLVAAIPGPYGVIAADQIGELAVHLVEGGHPAAGMDLLRAVLGGFSNPGATSGRSYDYVQVLRESVPPVARIVGRPVLALLVDELNRAVTSPAKGRSRIWRPAIEPLRERRSDTNVSNALVDVLIEIGTALHDDSILSVRDTALALAVGGPDVLRRIRLHLLRLRGYDAPDLVAECLLDPALAVDHAVEREYLLLAAAGHAWLEPPKVRSLLDFFDEQPDTTVWEQRIRREGVGAVEAEDLLRQRIDQWRRDRFAALEPLLHGDRRAHYETLVAQYGPAPDRSVPPPAAFTVWGGEGVIEAAELQQLTADALAQLLHEWQPPQDRRELDRSAIRPALAAAVAREATRWSTDAAAFIELPPEYVTSILDGFWEAARAKERLDWKPLTTLLAWIDGEATSELAAEVVQRRERKWRAARYSVMRLLTVDPTADPDRIPSDAEPAIWSIISAACADPDPQRQDTPNEPDDGELSSASLDAVRPEALRAAILWGLRAQQRPGYTGVPEVTQVLDAHVTPAADPALAVRAMFGQHLQALLRLDPDWTSRHLCDILPIEPEHTRAWRAAWNGHLENRVLTDAAWGLLRPHYLRAVDILTPTPNNEWEQARANLLAFHLGNRFWFGHLDLDDPDHLLQRFYEQAPAEAASIIVESVGLSFNRDEPTDPERRERLMRLWEYRIDAVRRGADPDELSAFDDWFVNGRFDDAWSLNQLYEILSLAPDMGLSVHVLRRLRTLALTHPHACLRVLDRVPGRPGHYWRTSRHRALIDEIIATTCTADDAAASAASRLVSAFAVDGFDFRSALNGDASSSAETDLSTG
ncbi:hypothetical protein AB0M79_09870 [Polymorphospora sp. NPDC051019]|uniref:hypothetical protein n=1 Tax=Polymorphospora sp. NPDC051019 TaxID=3155725 RepID=UPI0034358534